jgi:acetyl esterase/lipase
MLMSFECGCSDMVLISMLWNCDCRTILLGVSSGGNIADHVTRMAVRAASSVEPVTVVAQALMYPFFLGKVQTRSEIKLANSYFYDKSSCLLAWKLFLPDDEFDLDHPAVNPLNETREPPLAQMPPTLVSVAELDWMKDRAIAYAEALRKAGVDAPVLEYKDAVHEFATLDLLVKSRQAESCAEDMAIWIKKQVLAKGTEFSY